MKQFELYFGLTRKTNCGNNLLTNQKERNLKEHFHS